LKGKAKPPIQHFTTGTLKKRIRGDDDKEVPCTRYKGEGKKRGRLPYCPRQKALDCNTFAFRTMQRRGKNSGVPGKVDRERKKRPRSRKGTTSKEGGRCKRVNGGASVQGMRGQKISVGSGVSTWKVKLGRQKKRGEGTGFARG